MEHPGHSTWVHIRTPPFPWRSFIFWNTGILIRLHQMDCKDVMVVKCKSLAQSMDTQGLSLLYCSCISFALWDQESDAHPCVMFVENKWEKKGKQLRRIHNIRAFTNPSWVRITSKRCHSALWAKLICPFSEGCSPEGLNPLIVFEEMSYWSIQARAEDGEHGPAPTPAPAQGLTWPVSVKAPGRLFLVKAPVQHQHPGCGTRHGGRGLEGDPGGSPRIGAGVWNMESIKNGSFCHLMWIQRTGYTVGLLQSTSLPVFWTVERKSCELFTALSLPFPTSFAFRQNRMVVSWRSRSFLFLHKFSCAFAQILISLIFTYLPPSGASTFSPDLTTLTLQRRQGPCSVPPESPVLYCLQFWRCSIVPVCLLISCLTHRILSGRFSFLPF